MAATYDTLQLHRDAAVATVTMDQPKRRNALSPALDADLRAVFEALSADDAVRAIVLRANGPGFCAGADLTLLKEGLSPDQLYEHLTTRYLPLIQRIQHAPKPVIGAINGAAAGAGMALALACDLRLMADDAVQMMAFSNIAFVPDSGASYLLVRQVGYSRAFELAATADPLPADRCAALGLTNRVVPADELHDAADAWAHELAQRPTQALAQTKEVLAYAQDHGLADVIRKEAELQMEAVQTHDHREGVQAFLEKRAPDFQGR
ncbi:enoyl-CoA hydratase/isomerase family protein [Salisaeta longa]|uniref:enoyl-CoA hydratase/isomerase family protein n=1 Tax=Salisaeta longa TaxID=503170 RepID=UPI0003B35379|nr:enoyl-CoA hydratase-related protein [Salisaeta longa]